MRIYRSKTERKSSVRFSWVQFSWVHLDQLRCSHTRLWQMKMKPLKSRPRSIPASHLRLLQRCWWISSEKQQYWRIWCDMINSFANPISDVCANNSHIKPVLCLQPCFPCSACSSGNSVLAPSHWLTSLSLFRLQGWPFPSGVGQRCGRWDVLQQGEHDSGRPAFTALRWRHCLEMIIWYGEKHAVGCDLQKRTWESNKNDIRICRMKGKHEVRQLYFVSAGHIINYLSYFRHVSCFLCEFMSYFCTAPGLACL